MEAEVTRRRLLRGWTVWYSSSGQAQATTMEFPTWVEVDLDRFRRNIGAIRAAVGDGRGILLVVKADAYGHGAVEIARHAIPSGVTMLGVATLHEGIELRASGITAPIVILSPALLSEVDEIIEHRLTPCIRSCRAFTSRSTPEWGGPGWGMRKPSRSSSAWSDSRIWSSKAYSPISR